MDNLNLEQLVAVAYEATVVACSFIKNSSSIDTLSSLGKDIKTNIDLESNKIILDVLAKTNIPVISEEIENVDIKNDLYWVVDPLDGTYNLTRGLTSFVCTSVALIHKSNPIIGIIGFCFLDKILFCTSQTDFKILSNHENINDLYKNILGSEEKESLNVKKNQNLSQSCLVTGFPVGILNLEKNIADLSTLAKNVKKIRMIGSAASSLGLVAQKQVDLYFERDIFYWDVIAGLALVSATGGDYFIDVNWTTKKCVVLASWSKDILQEASHILNLK